MKKAIPNKQTRHIKPILIDQKTVKIVCLVSELVVGSGEQDM